MGTPRRCSCLRTPDPWGRRGSVHEALILLGWLHEEVKGCCRRSTVGKPEPLNPIATDATPWSTATGRSGRAFGGSERNKNELLAALVEQRRRGAVVREEPTAICDFRIRLGCPVPCQRSHTATDGHPAKDLDDHHRLWRTLHGVPAPLSALEDAVFSNLPPDLAAEWPERFVSAIPAGADLAMTADRWLLWLLTETDSPLAPVDEKLKEPAELLRRRLAGDEPSVDEWRGVPGFSGIRWSEGAIAGIAGAVARAGAATSDLDAAREVAGAVDSCRECSHAIAGARNDCQSPAGTGARSQGSARPRRQSPCSHALAGRNREERSRRHAVRAGSRASMEADGRSPRRGHCNELMRFWHCRSGRHLQGSCTGRQLGGVRHSNRRAR